MKMDVLDGQADGWADGQADGWGRMDGLMGRQMGGE